MQTAKSCDDSCITPVVPPSRLNLQDEHIASRKGWVTYIFLKTAVNRAGVEQADDFIAHVRERLQQAKRRR